MWGSRWPGFLYRVLLLWNPRGDAFIGLAVAPLLILQTELEESYYCYPARKIPAFTLYQCALILWEKYKVHVNWIEKLCLLKIMIRNHDGKR